MDKDGSDSVDGDEFGKMCLELGIVTAQVHAGAIFTEIDKVFSLILFLQRGSRLVDLSDTQGYVVRVMVSSLNYLILRVIWLGLWSAR